MLNYLHKLFGTDFLPHGYCMRWQSDLLWLHVVSDALITLSYLCIPIVLIYFVRKRRDLEFHWMFVAFGVFILACGATHIMAIWTLWTPMYRLEGLIKAVTAAASVITAICLTRLLPELLRIPSPQQLES